jgi:hypothetical protein
MTPAPCDVRLPRHPSTQSVAGWCGICTLSRINLSATHDAACASLGGARSCPAPAILAGPRKRALAQAGRSWVRQKRGRPPPNGPPPIRPRSPWRPTLPIRPGSKVSLRSGPRTPERWPTCGRWPTVGWPTCGRWPTGRWRTRGRWPAGGWPTRRALAYRALAYARALAYRALAYARALPPFCLAIRAPANRIEPSRRVMSTGLVMSSLCVIFVRHQPDMDRGRGRIT